MTARRTSVRKSTASDVPAVLAGVVTETPAPAPVSRRRRPAIKVPADVPETDQEMEAKIDKKPVRRTAAKKTAAKVEIVVPAVRHTSEYEVDLLNEGEESERDFSKMLAKSPSETHLAFVEWVQEQMDVEIDARTVQILISTYHEFQRSPGQKAKMIEKRRIAAEKKALAAAKKQTAK